MRYLTTRIFVNHNNSRSGWQSGQTRFIHKSLVQFRCGSYEYAVGEPGRHALVFIVLRKPMCPNSGLSEVSKNGLILLTKPICFPLRFEPDEQIGLIMLKEPTCSELWVEPGLQNCISPVQEPMCSNTKVEIRSQQTWVR